ncbi:hypothetical protein [Ammoniphilus sp. CFH 90114]|uniref:hypothetical protein n=1 Tax=Ammoniphilus sp. CFH 90114 TaxID=2493665 RepID=UPI00100E8674|nr:hypothetical protein [Ammoniphilus sp. CFH 90114]RXT09103.1 hypothetical protein EIZ39_10050 [Ammoniphilus sp. CFH 90114]
MSSDSLRDFMKDLTSLCDQYHLWVEGENIRIEDDNGNMVGTFMAYNDQAEIYTAKLIGEPIDEDGE